MADTTGPCGLQIHNSWVTNGKIKSEVSIFEDSPKEFCVWETGFWKDCSAKERESCSDKGGNAVTELSWRNRGKN